MRNSMVLINVAVCFVLLVQVSHSLPTGGGSRVDEDHESAAARSLSAIVRDLERAVFDLKVYSDAASAAAVDSTADQLQHGNNGNDISLREALEFLNELAKQNKQHRRDYDIPFPFNNHGVNSEKK